MDLNLNSIPIREKIDLSLFRRSPRDEKAYQIIRDIKNKKIQFKPTTETHNTICNAIRSIISRYDRTHVLSLSYIRVILQAYEEAEFYGIIEKTESGKIAELEEIIEEKNKEIADLSKKLAKYEGNDKPDDALYSDLKEEE